LQKGFRFPELAVKSRVTPAYLEQLVPEARWRLGLRQQLNALNEGQLIGAEKLHPGQQGLQPAHAPSEVLRDQGAWDARVVKVVTQLYQRVNHLRDDRLQSQCLAPRRSESEVEQLRHHQQVTTVSAHRTACPATYQKKGSVSHRAGTPRGSGAASRHPWPQSPHLMSGQKHPRSNSDCHDGLRVSSQGETRMRARG